MSAMARLPRLSLLALIRTITIAAVLHRAASEYNSQHPAFAPLPTCRHAMNVLPPRLSVCFTLPAALFLLLGSAVFAAEGWFDFQPPRDNFAADCPLDLRRLNEKVAGEHGGIVAKDGQFVFRDTNQPVRFWAVNGPPDDLEGEDLRRCARLLAKYGVNLVRVHTPIFDKSGEPDLAKVKRAHEIVAALKAEGIYTHFSVYFPLWFTPSAELPWLQGYDGQRHPFAALMFNEQFQAKYRNWLKTLLTTPDEKTGRALLADPAVFGVEIQNEDSFFFWTFDARNIPDPQLRIIESQFGDWLVKKHGSLEAALKSWRSKQLPRDVFDEGRVALRPLWNIANERSLRDQDTAAFLVAAQTDFYQHNVNFLRELGFHGMVTASNWHTASPERFGPLEKLTYMTGDFVDRHGYFECNHKGDNAAWSIRPGHTFSQRSALRFDGSEPGKPKEFVHPVMDPQYNDKPSMISETTFTRPNRYRSEAPLYFAAYGALQDSDAIVHFAFDGAQWQVKPRFWMQQWTLATPAMLAQFPAAALVYRRGLVAPGDVLADVKLNIDELTRLGGTPLPQEASFDELRLKDVPQGVELKPGQRLDPLLHYAGRATIEFTNEPGKVTAVDLQPFVDHERKQILSTTGELRLDYGNGVLVIQSPQAQGVSGDLKAVGKLELPALSIHSDLDLAHIIAVSLDDQPLAKSKRILLQVMTEERPTGFAVEDAGQGVLRITNIGRDPWQVKDMQGTVSLKRPDATRLKVTALDQNGYPGKVLGDAANIELQPTTLYYLISE